MSTPADSQTVEQCLSFLSRKDDTSRFVGLAMLSSFLTHVQDRQVLVRCWEALDQRFLDRLLKAGMKKTTEETRDMVELAVNVIHAFATLLPDAAEDEKLVARAGGLVGVVLKCSAVTTATVVQTLLVFSTGRKGAESILGVRDILPLVEVGKEHETAMQVLQYAFVNASSMVVEERLQTFLPELCDGITGMEKPQRLQVLGFLSELLTRIPPERLPPSTSWATTLYTAIATIITSPHTSKERHYTTIITASLLHRYPPSLLFDTTPTTTSDKPFLYFFLQLTLIDLRASFPSLLESLNTPSYGTTAHRLAAAFDIVAAFLGHLITSSAFILTPELLLKLRSDLSETFSLTLEFLRERWDAAFAGAEGFEAGHEDRGMPLSLTWDSGLTGGLLKDPVVVASVRALSLWLREEESLRGEAGGMVDFFLGLWVRGLEVGVDYRVWVVGALEGVVEEDHGRAQFVRYGGWGVVWGDLKRVYGMRDAGEEEVRLAIAEARLLVEVVTMEGRCEEGWVKDVVGTANIKGGSAVRVELDAEVLKLASACLANVGRGNRKRLEGEVRKVREVAGRLMVDLGGNKGGEEALGLVVEVLQELEEMGC